VSFAGGPGPLADRWTSGDAYDRYVGRWSRLVAVAFVRWVGVPPGADWLDVGCGTGALTEAILRAARPRRVVGIDPTEPFIAQARSRARGAAVAEAEARWLPFADGTFDAVVSGLVLNFVPEPARAAAEMARVARPGGRVAAYVWDYAEGMQLIRRFWDAAVALDEAAAVLDEGLRFSLCRPEGLRALLQGAGLAAVEVHGIDVPTVFRDFEDLWSGFAGGQGPAPHLRRLALGGPAACAPRAAPGVAAEGAGRLHPARGPGVGRERDPLM
jgi:SAM-dependent methyltransferase